MARGKAALGETAPAEPAAAPVEFEWVPHTRLRPWALNPNEGDPQGVADSIKALGWGRPIIANRYPKLEGEVIVGHHALLAAALLGDFVPPGAPGPGLVPVRWVNLPAKQAHALSLADNERGRKSKVNRDKLGMVVGLDELDPGDWLAAGFTEKDIKSLMFEPWPAPAEDHDAPRLRYSIIIECDDELHQTTLLERFEAEALKCKPWVG